MEALGRIEVVDRQASAGEACELAARACRAAPELPTKRVVFLSDMQAETSGAQNLGEFFKPLGDVQIVQIGPAERTNTWVSDLHLRDGIASADAPAVFVATIRHAGPKPRPNVQVTLRIDGEAVAQRRVDLLPGQNLEVTFEHSFDVAGTPARPLYASARVELTPDRLDDDDFRTIVVPVVSRLPVVFVDNLGRDENPPLGRYGETFPLRRLLSPKTANPDETGRLIAVRRRKPDALTRDDLKDARLAVIAGVDRPSAETRPPAAAIRAAGRHAADRRRRGFRPRRVAGGRVERRRRYPPGPAQGHPHRPTPRPASDRRAGVSSRGRDDVRPRLPPRPSAGRAGGHHHRSVLLQGRRGGRGGDGGGRAGHPHEHRAPARVS